MLRRAVLLLLATLATLEIGSFLAVEIGLLPAPRPSYGREAYWWGDHPQLGVWRRPGAELEHRSACFHARYRSNAAGARDLERRRETRTGRVIVLGDSFLAGWGLRDGERLSNRLEALTSIEHLNFAMPHFSPYQSLLAYRELARGWSHSGVMIGVLPVNDFVDGDPALAAQLPDYAYRYRPYLVGGPPDWVQRDEREPRLRRLLRSYSYATNALLLGTRVVGSRFAEPAGPVPEAATRAPSSWYYDFAESDAARLEAVLEALVDAAEGRPVAVLLIPAIQDMRRFAREGPSPLTQRLAVLARRRPALEIVDLLPTLVREPRPWTKLYFPCDYHWNARANRAAAGGVLAALESDFYPRVRAAGAGSRRGAIPEPPDAR